MTDLGRVGSPARDGRAGIDIEALSIFTVSDIERTTKFWTEIMARELASHGITVNAICPGSVDTRPA